MIVMFMHRWSLAVLLGLLASIGACSNDDVSSETIATRRFYASMSVRAESPGLSRVLVSFQVDDPLGANIELLDGEFLEASVAGLTQTMIEDNRFFSIDYVTRFNTSSDADPFRIRLTRANGSVFDDSFVSLRPEFAVVSPVPGQLVSFRGDLSMEWAPADPGESLVARFRTACRTMTGALAFATSTATLDDDGSELFDLGQLPAATDSTIDQSTACTLDVDFQRSATGTLDPAFEAGGRITSTQSREIENLTVLF